MITKFPKVQVFALLAVACAVVGLTFGVTTSGASGPAPRDRAERGPVAQYEILKSDGDPNWKAAIETRLQELDHPNPSEAIEKIERAKKQNRTMLANAGKWVSTQPPIIPIAEPKRGITSVNRGSY